MKCPHCEHDGLTWGQLSCPECDRDLSDFWPALNRRPAAEPEPFDPFAPPAPAPGQQPVLAAGEPAVPVLDLSILNEPAAAPPAPPAGPAVAAAPATPCPTCGTPLGAGSSFCDKCGAGVAAPCPACRKDNRPGARFCQHCGGSLGPAAPPSGTSLLPGWESRPRRFQLIIYGKDGTEFRRVDLKEGDNQVGARSPGEQIFPDIDLDPADSDKVVSRRHAVLRVESDQVVLVDRGSTNGTRVNDRPVSSTPVAVNEQSDIVFANVRCRLRVQ